MRMTGSELEAVAHALNVIESRFNSFTGEVSISHGNDVLVFNVFYPEDDSNAFVEVES